MNRNKTFFVGFIGYFILHSSQVLGATFDQCYSARWATSFRPLVWIVVLCIFKDTMYMNEIDEYTDELGNSPNAQWIR